MIVSAFSFFNELDLLDLRLHELDQVVDRFVLVEATLTHAGKPKPLYYEENKVRFSQFRDKICHIIVDDMPVTKQQCSAAYDYWDRHWIPDGYLTGDNWIRERYQRNQMMKGIQDCDPDDIVIIEDADEMVKPEILQSIEKTIVDGSNAVEQILHTYFMNFKCTNMKWAGSKILRRKFVTDPSEHRFHTPASGVILNGGWHFNFLGGVEAIKLKLQSYAHQEFNNDEVFGRLGDYLIQKKDALGRLYQYEVVPIDENYPKYLRENPDKFRKYMW